MAVCLVASTMLQDLGFWIKALGFGVYGSWVVPVRLQLKLAYSYNPYISPNWGLILPKEFPEGPRRKPKGQTPRFKLEIFEDSAGSRMCGPMGARNARQAN